MQLKITAENKSRTIIVAAVVALVVIAGAGFWYWQSKKSAAPAADTSASASPTSVIEEAGESIGAVIFEKTQDPLKENIPETNPLKRVIVNPF